MKSDSEKAARRARDRRTREEDFLGAAERLFAARAFHGTGMEDIAAAAGYATGTIYRYFPSKEALYRALLDRKGAEFEAAQARAARPGQSAPEALRALIGFSYGYFERHRAFLEIYVRDVLPEGSVLETGLGRTGQAARRRSLGRLRAVFARGMREGAFRRMDLDLLMTAVVGMTNGLLRDSLRARRPMKETEDFVLDLLLRGLAAKETSG